MFSHYIWSIQIAWNAVCIIICQDLSGLKDGQLDPHGRTGQSLHNWYSGTFSFWTGNSWFSQCRGPGWRWAPLFPTILGWQPVCGRMWVKIAHSKHRSVYVISASALSGFNLLNDDLYWYCSLFGLLFHTGHSFFSNSSFWYSYIFYLLHLKTVCQKWYTGSPGHSKNPRPQMLVNILNIWYK